MGSDNSGTPSKDLGYFGYGLNFFFFYAKFHISFQWCGSWKPLSDPLVYTSHFLHFQ
jgi:hypothetical protein